LRRRRAPARLAGESAAETGVADRHAPRTGRAERWDKQNEESGGEDNHRRLPLTLPPERGRIRRKRER
jgi:hypothetical protein